MTEPTLEVRIWIDGQLVVSDRLTAWSVDGLGAAHTQLVADAAQLGKKWLVQVTDPDAPEHSRHVRFGDDTAGMVDPQPLPVDAAAAIETLEEESAKRFGYGQGRDGGS